MSASKTIFDIDRQSNFETEEEVFEALADFASSVADAMGLVVRDDLTVVKPSYAPHSKVMFLSETDESSPVFSIYNGNTDAGIRYLGSFALSICKYSNGIWSPTSVMGYNNRGDGVKKFGDGNGMGRDGIVFGYPTYKIKMQKVEFDDGRILFTFMDTKNDGTPANAPNSCSILKTDIYHATEGKLGTYIIFGDAIRSSWIDSLETNLGVNDNSSFYIDFSSMAYAYHMYPANGREFIYGKTLWLDQNSYIDNIYMFSNNGNIIDGKGVTIQGDKYYNVRHYTNIRNGLLIPEEV